jgi:tetratricopeptide (TPR) repeat protein
MKTIDFSYFIERYIASEMDLTEIKWFEKELEGNDTLQKEVMLRKKADHMMLNHDLISLRNKLAGLEKSRKEKLVESAGKKALGIRYAAVFTGLVLIGSLLMLIGRNQNSKALFDKNFTVYESTTVSRSIQAGADIELTRALKFYADKDYTEAGRYFSDYLKSNSGNMQATLLYAISKMETKNYQVAKSSFDKIIKSGNNLYIDQAEWYLALCYVATGETTVAKQQLLAIKKSDSIYRDKARKMLRNF